MESQCSSRREFSGRGPPGLISRWASSRLVLAATLAILAATTSPGVDALHRGEQPKRARSSTAPSVAAVRALLRGGAGEGGTAAETSQSGRYYGVYKNHGQDWMTGICHSREKQSPINIDDKLKDPPLGVIEYDYKPIADVNLTITSTDGILHFIPPGHPSDFGGLKYDGDWYGLGRVDFHSRAEHLIKGDRYPVEMQFVHSRPGNPIRYAIISVLFNAEKAPDGLPAKNAVSAPFAVPDPAEVDFNPAFQHFVEAEPPKIDGNTTLLTIPADKPLDLGAFVGDLVHGEGTFVEYAGSLTSPPCSETVTWFVRREVQMLSVGQAMALQNAVMNMTTNTGNFRSPMPLNYRPFKAVKAVRTPGLDHHKVVRPQLPMGPNPRNDDEYRTAGYVNRVMEGTRDAKDFLKGMFDRMKNAANEQVKLYRPLK